MKLIRFGERGNEKPGVLLPSGRYVDVSGHFKDYNRDFFINGGLEKLQAVVESENETLPDIPPSVRIGSPIARPGKVICIGLNYREHAKESGSKIPDEPVVFMKAPTAVQGPNDTIIIPRGSTHTDWEVELGIVIGKDIHYLGSIEESMDCIAGFCIVNDVSERAYQKATPQWTKGKSCDSFCPTGPLLVTADDISDVQNLNMSLDVNSQRRQTGNTVDMIFGVKFLIHNLSQYMTLEAGDLISTGTPPGVGFGMKPPMFLKAGDVVTLQIEGLGEQRAVCVDA